MYTTTLLELINSWVPAVKSIFYEESTHSYNFSIIETTDSTFNISLEVVRVKAYKDNRGKKTIDAFILPTLTCDLAIQYYEINSLWDRIREQYIKLQRKQHNQTFLKRFLFLL